MNKSATKKDRRKGRSSLGRTHNAVQHCAIHQKRQLYVRFKVIYCLAVRISCGWHVFRCAPPRIFIGGLEKAGLLASDVQIDAQNAPFNLQLVMSKLLETLIRQCWEVYILRTMTPPSGTIFAKILSHTLKICAFILHYLLVSPKTARWRLGFFIQSSV